MKKFILPLLLLTATSLVYAGGHKDKYHNAPDQGKMHARMVEQLQLNPEQADAVKEIMAEGKAERQTIREESRAKMAALKDAQREKLASVLDEEQMQKLEELHEKKAHKHKKKYKE